MIRDVRAFEYKCDRCGEIHVQENAVTHYTNSRPPGWSTLKLTRDGRDGSLPVLTSDRLSSVKDERPVLIRIDELLVHLMH